jgi:hypothetical protein
MSAKGPAKGTATIQRLLDERRKYESWLARLRSAADASAAPVRERVEADYTARLKAVDEELKVHAEAARQLIAERYETVTELRSREQAAAERLAEGELRHTVGEYDDEQWAQFRKDALAELVAVREELQELEADLRQLEEVNALVSGTPAASVPPPPPPPPAAPVTEKPSPRVGPPPRPAPKAEPPREKKVAVDELAFIKSVTDDDRVPSPRRASGAQFQPPEPVTPTPPRGNSGGDEPLLEQKADAGAPRTLKCPECGTMNMPTEWYCEQCGAELAAL